MSNYYDLKNTSLNQMKAQILSGGYKVQSGTISAATAGSYTLTFPTAFEGTPVVLGLYFTNGNNASVPVTLTAVSASAATFYIGSAYSGGYIHWLAID